MAVMNVTVDGVEYPVAPLEPELHDKPTPAHLMAITPEVARSWLGYNWRNRNQRESGKKDYSSDMGAKAFAINGSTITFSRPLAEGEDEDVPAGKPVLMDGQHRLEACERSRTPFVTYVAFGIDPGVRPTIDTGIKRSYSDVLTMRGEVNAVVLSSVVRKVHAWANGDFHLTMKRVSATNTQMDMFLAEHPEIRRSAQVASSTHHEFKLSSGHNLRQSVVGVAHWLFTRADESLAPEFFARLGDGAQMPVGHPIMALRRRLVKDLTERKQVQTRREIPFVPDWTQLCYYIRSWNAFLAWSVSTEAELAQFPPHAMLGPNDSKRMPQVKEVRQISVRKESKALKREADELSA